MSDMTSIVQKDSKSSTLLCNSSSDDLEAYWSLVKNEMSIMDIRTKSRFCQPGLGFPLEHFDTNFS